MTFDRFDVDVNRGQLRKDGRLVRVQTKPLLLLAALIARPGQVVTREELQAVLWPGNTHVEFDAGLNTAVRKLRRALGDSAAQARFIQTIPGIGYRFVAPIADRELLRAKPAPSTVSPVTQAASSMIPRTAALAPVARRSMRVGAHSRAAVLILLTLLGVSFHQLPAIAESVFIKRACQLADAKQPALALRTIERGLAWHPRSATLRAHRGLYLHAVGRYDEEMLALLDAVTLDATSAEAQFHLGLGFARRREYAHSLSALEKAVSLSSGDLRYISWLGRIAADAGRLPQAEEVLSTLRRRAATSPVPSDLIDAVAYHLSVSRR